MDIFENHQTINHLISVSELEIHNVRFYEPMFMKWRPKFLINEVENNENTYKIIETKSKYRLTRAKISARCTIRIIGRIISIFHTESNYSMLKW